MNSGRTVLALTFLLTLSFCTTPIAQTGDAAARGRAAARAMSDGRFDDAATIYRDLLGAMPNDPGVLMNLGMALAMGGH